MWYWGLFDEGIFLERCVGTIDTPFCLVQGLFHAGILTAYLVLQGLYLGLMIWDILGECMECREQLL